MLHEDRGILASVFHIPQALILAAYATWICYFAFRFRGTILKTHYAPLLSGCALLAFSMLVDMIEGGHILNVGLDLPAHQMLEDGPKLMGVSGWLVYFVSIASREMALALNAFTVREEISLAEFSPDAIAATEETVRSYSMGN
jgi:hypothetical protein